MEVARMEEPPVQKPAHHEQEMKFVDYDFTSITEYGWEDTNETTAKIYLLKGLDGIKQHDVSKIQCEFEPMSVDLKIRDFKGKNYRFRIDPLFDGLAVEHCTINIKSNSITITLRKENKKKWSALKFVKAISRTTDDEMENAVKDNKPETLMDMF
jgi:hypothetical protein